MGTAQPGEDPKTMTNSALTNSGSTHSMKRTDEEKSEARRRLHLRDITNELPGSGDDRVGADLRIARERRGEDMRAIALSLRIRREQLEALEESRYDDLPGRAYAVGFVRSYAEYLGLDSAHIVSRYKAELDGSHDLPEEVIFPEASEDTRLPRGTFLIIALIIGVGIYGGYLMTRSADRMIAERVPAVSSDMGNVTAQNTSENAAPRLSGDPASAATRPAGEGNGAVLQDEVLPEDAAELASVYAVPPVVEDEAAPAAQDIPGEQAALTPQSAEMGLAPEAAAPAAPVLPEIALGAVYGAENVDSRVLIRARKADAWVRVENAQGHVLIERTLALGDVYHAPNVPGTILVARDASAFELVVDGQSLGLAGPPTLVLTGKPLEPAALIAAMPRPAPTAAEEAAAIAPTAIR